MIESWRRHSNTVRPRGIIGDRPPAPELFVPAFAAWPAALTRPAPPARLPVVQRPTVHSHQTRTTQGGRSVSPAPAPGCHFTLIRSPSSPVNPPVEGPQATVRLLSAPFLEVSS